MKSSRVRQGTIQLESVPEVPPELKYRLLQWNNTRSCSLNDWVWATGDKTGPAVAGMLVSTRFADVTQLHVVKAPEGYRKQITFFPEPILSARVCPNPYSPQRDTLLFTKDIGGSEQYQIYSWNLTTGTHSLLTDGSSKHGVVKWAHNGLQFAFNSTERNGRDRDIWIGSFNPDGTVSRRIALEVEGTWWPCDFSPDDSKLVVKHYYSVTHSEIHMLNLATGSLEQINPREEHISYGAVKFDPRGDGDFLYVTCDMDSEFAQLWRWNLGLSRYDPETPISAAIPWDLGEIAISSCGNIAFTVNEGGITKAYFLNPITLAISPVRHVPNGIVSSLRFHPLDGSRLAMRVNSSTTPGDVFEVNCSTSCRWTVSEVGGLDTSRFVEPKLIQYPTFDVVEASKRARDGDPKSCAREIPAFYWRPRGEGPHPVLIMIHGGPESQFRPVFRSMLQYYVVERGIAVLAPNGDGYFPPVRGSDGYGKTYLKLDDKFLREDSVKDIGALLDWISTRSELDSSRVAVRGGSYGGYMVLAAMIRFGARLKFGVDVVGISNFVTFLENTSEYRRNLRRQEYGDERDPKMREFLQAISPLTRASEINKPMLIAQGGNDPRVPASESEQISAAVRANGVPCWYMLADDEGHGFRKKKNIEVYTQIEALFVETFL